MVVTWETTYVPNPARGSFPFQNRHGSLSKGLGAGAPLSPCGSLDRCWTPVARAGRALGGA